MKRNKFYKLIAFFVCGIFSPLHLLGQPTYSSERSEWIYFGTDGKLVYKTTPNGDRIMDFSYAGYKGGGVVLPDIPVKITVKPSGEGDDTQTIQTAIDKISLLKPDKDGFRGTVFLSPGVYTCSQSITIEKSGIILRGSGSSLENTNKDKISTIRMTGGKHTAIIIGLSGKNSSKHDNIKTFLTEHYVPSGCSSFSVRSTYGFNVGDIIDLRHPVTKAWVHFMQMDDLVRDGNPQTWLREGSQLITQRRIKSITGNRITVDVPLSDSYNAEYLDPPGTEVVQVAISKQLEQVAIEHIHIISPEQEVNHTQELYTAIRLNGTNCWMKDILIEETMNSVSVGGQFITLDQVVVVRKALHLGASKPAEFAPNAGQILLNRCSVVADNVWFAATGAGISGPIVFLNCTFKGDGHIEGHQRWSTGMLLDNCHLPEGGIDFKNRGSMGSGHGWGIGWAVAWNCVAKSFVVQQPPGAYNWAIGCIGEIVSLPRPFNTEGLLPSGIFESHGKPVYPQSLYLTQLAERLGKNALKNIGYDLP